MAKTKRTEDAKPPLELMWMRADELDGNPHNWKTHSTEQLKSLDALITNPKVGWAGACLYNRRTKRLIDGHGRKQRSRPDELLPVLVGEWDEEAEKLILATLDPIGAMADGQAADFAALTEQIEADDLYLRDLMESTQRELDASTPKADDGDDAALPESLAEMEAQPFEHHDYIVLMFGTAADHDAACELLGVQRVAQVYPGGKQKVGLGRVLDGVKAIERLRKGADRASGDS